MTTRNKRHYPGVHWVRSHKRYGATVVVNGVEVLLGYYPSENDAYSVRTDVRRVLQAAGVYGGDKIPNRPEQRQ